MATRQTTGVIQHACRSVFLRDGPETTDAQLLEDYIRGDQASFAALVRRHAPMVWGVCRRLLHNFHDAEDAFQATFLVLVRKAPSIMPREMAPNWLYGVAYQIALKARATATKRSRRERQVVAIPESEASEQSRLQDVKLFLDEELSRLPDKYRVAIVLCDLEGRTRKEVALQLGLPEGTVAGRLTRARAMLSKRFARRGVSLSSGVIGAVLSQNGAAFAVPISVVASTIKVGSLCAAGQAIASATVSPAVTALMKGVLRTMLINKAKAGTLVVAVILAVGWGSALTYQAATAAKQDQTQTRDVVEHTDAATKKGPNDNSGLQGTWKVSQADFNGPSWLDAGGMREWVVTADTITIKYTNNMRIMTYVVNAKVQPKAIDVTPAMEGLAVTVRKGIFETTGDQLRVCLESDSTVERPRDFTLKGSRPGRALVTLQRVPRPKVDKWVHLDLDLDRLLPGTWTGRGLIPTTLKLAADGAYSWGPPGNHEDGVWDMKTTQLPFVLILATKNKVTRWQLRELTETTMVLEDPDGARTIGYRRVVPAEQKPAKKSQEQGF